MSVDLRIYQVAPESIEQAGEAPAGGGTASTLPIAPLSLTVLPWFVLNNDGRSGLGTALNYGYKRWVLAYQSSRAPSKALVWWALIHLDWACCLRRGDIVGLSTALSCLKPLAVA